MTIDEAIKKMQAVKAYMISGNPIWSVTEMGEAFDMAIESLTERKGKWIGYNAEDNKWLRDDGQPIFLTCSECGNTVMNNGSPYWNYCPNCGARMEGERNE